MPNRLKTNFQALEVTKCNIKMLGTFLVYLKPLFRPYPSRPPPHHGLFGGEGYKKHQKFMENWIFEKNLYFLRIFVMEPVGYPIKK